MPAFPTTDIAGMTPAPSLVPSGNLQLRILSSVILAPIALLAIYAGGVIYNLLVVVIFMQAMREWLRLTNPPGDPQPNPAVIAVAFGTLLVLLAQGILITPLFGIAGAFFTLAIYLLARPSGQQRAIWIALGLPYLAGGGLALIYLRGLYPYGQAMLFYLVAVIWATDSCAYFAGKAIGGPKLAPVISPKKTWAGFIGGILAAGLIGHGVAYFTHLPHQGFAAPLAMAMAVTAQIGDLFESIVKRRSGAKESSHLIPGHGGMLDRIDGLIFAAIFLALLQLLAHGLMPDHTM